MPADSNHRVADAVVELETEHREVGLRASGVTDEVLRGEPQLSLERTSVDAGIGPRLQFYGEIAPTRSEMFREVFHGGSGRPLFGDRYESYGVPGSGNSRHVFLAER